MAKSLHKHFDKWNVLPVKEFAPSGGANMAQAIATRNQTFHNEMSVLCDVKVTDLSNRQWRDAAIPSGELKAAHKDRSYPPDQARSPAGYAGHRVKIAIQ